MANRLAAANANALIFINKSPPEGCESMHIECELVKTPFDEPAAVSARRQDQPGEHTAEVLALLEAHRPAVDLGNVADDCEPKSRARLAGGVEPRAAGEQLPATLLGDARTVVLNQDVDLAAIRLDRHEDAPAPVLCGILD